jgi:uncharacterized membrane protein YozB (DUF420 family)
MKGFLGTGATFAADLNLVMQALMGSALVVGTFLARRKRYTAHGICQTTVLLLNLVTIALVMGPSFHRQVVPALPEHLGDRYYAVATGHAALGIAAELLGLYIVLVAGTNFVPRRLRFQRWKLWMRAELALWWVVLLTGVGAYYAWYVAPAAP